MPPKRHYTLHPRSPGDIHHRGEWFVPRYMRLRPGDVVEDISDDDTPPPEDISDDDTPPSPPRRSPPQAAVRRPPHAAVDNELVMTPALSKLIDDVVSREFPGLTEESVMAALTSPPAAQAAVARPPPPPPPPRKRARVTNIRLADDGDRYVVSPPGPMLVVRPVLHQARPTAPAVNNNNNGSSSLVNTLVPLGEYTHRQQQKKAKDQRARNKKAEDELDDFTAELLSMPANYAVRLTPPPPKSPEERAREAVATLLRNAKEAMDAAKYKRFLKTHRGSNPNTQDSP